MGARRVGILAIQGDVEAHRRALARLGVAALPVRAAKDLDGIAALILPGGESTTISKGLARVALYEPIRAFAQAGRPVLGTCAGLIMLATDLDGEPSGAHGVRTLGLLDCTVRRNAYGRQIDSFTAAVPLEGLGSAATASPFPAVFIRAPRLERVGPDVEVLARHDGEPVAVRQGRLLGLAFHPELTDDLRLHRAFLEFA